MPQFYRKPNNIERKQKIKNQSQRLQYLLTTAYGIRNAENFECFWSPNLRTSKEDIEKKKNCSCIIPLFRCVCVFLSSHQHFDIKFFPFFIPRVHFWKKKKSYQTFCVFALFSSSLNFFVIQCWPFFSHSVEKFHAASSFLLAHQSKEIIWIVTHEENKENPKI